MEINKNQICKEEVKIEIVYSPIKRTLLCKMPSGEHTYENITTYGELLDAINDFTIECYYYEP